MNQPMDFNQSKPQERGVVAILARLVEIATIIGLIIAIIQYRQNLQESNAQDNRQATLVAIMNQQLDAQRTLVAGSQNQSSAQELAHMQATVDALENERRKLLDQPTLTPETAPVSNAVAASDTVVPTTTVAATQTITTTNEPSQLSFSDPNNPKALNPIFGWQPGSAIANSYDLTLAPGTLTLIAGPGTDQWQGTNTAPFVVLPISGNFDVSVKVKVHPIENYQRAGIGVRSIQDANTWVSIARHYNYAISGSQGILALGNQHGNSSYLSNVPYSKEECFFKIERRGAILTLSYSENGTNWVLLQDGYVANFVDPVEIFLMASSTSNQGITAQFSDFILSKKP